MTGGGEGVGNLYILWVSPHFIITNLKREEKIYIISKHNPPKPPLYNTTTD
jgi:hypothetical protein